MTLTLTRRVGGWRQRSLPRLIKGMLTPTAIGTTGVMVGGPDGAGDDLRPQPSSPHDQPTRRATMEIARRLE